MDNKVNAYLHNCLTWLAEDCLIVTDEYDKRRRYQYPEKAEETVMLDIGEDVGDIEKALEVFQNAEMMTVEESGLCRIAAYQMRLEAKANLRRHMEQKGDWR